MMMHAGAAQLVNPQQGHPNSKPHQHNGIGSPQCHLAAATVLLILQPMLYLLSGFLYCFLVHAAMTPPLLQKLKNL